MQINKLEIKRYKNFRDFNGDFKQGINFISGPNEAGKSTIVEAITDLFFTDPASGRKALKDKVGWDCEQAFELSMEFSDDESAWLLHKDFERGEALLIKQSSGEEISDKRRILEIIDSMTGMANPDIFLATTTIRQGEIERVSYSSEAIKDKLEGLITGGQEEILASDALNKIEDEIRTIKKEGTRHLGVLQKLEKTKAELIYELDKAKREIDQIAANRVKLRETKELLSSIETEYKAKKSHMDKASQAFQIDEKLKKLEDSFQDLNNRVKSIKDSEEIVANLREEIDDLPKIDSADLSLAEEQAVHARFLNNKKEDMQEKVEDLSDRMEEAKPSIFIKLITVFFFLVSAGGGAYSYFISNFADLRFLYGAGGALLVSIVFLTVWSSKAKKASHIKLKFNLKATSFEELVSDLERANEAVEQILTKYKVDSISKLKDSYETYRDLDKEIKSEIKRYDHWLSGKSLKDLEKEFAQVTKDLAVENETARDLKMYSLAPEEIDKLKVLVDAMEKQKTNLKSTEIALTRQIEFAESGCELQASLEERLEEIDRTIERTVYHQKVLEKTRDFIEKARKNVLKASLGMLEQDTSEILSEITAGKYSKVKFDRQSLKFEVFSAEKDDWVNPDKDLSQGTRDQLYLAARMSLVRIISMDRTPLLIFDEPFLTFDKNRRANALRLLNECKDKYQILILSCNDYYLECADNHISLETEREIPQAVPA